MKETEKTIKDKIEITGQKEISNGVELLGSVKNLRRGHTIFEINHDTKIPVPAIFYSELKVDINSIDGLKRIKNVSVKPNCYYVLALNSRNALKHYNHRSNA